MWLQQLRTFGHVLAAHPIPGEPVPEQIKVYVAVVVLGHEAEHLVSVHKAGCPVQPPLVGVRLVRVVQVQVGGGSQNHLARCVCKIQVNR